MNSIKIVMIFCLTMFVSACWGTKEKQAAPEVPVEQSMEVTPEPVPTPESPTESNSEGVPVDSSSQ